MAKRRAARRERTAETKGKQNDCQRVYRQQKNAAESTEEKKTRLAKRREATKTKTSETKCKQSEYQRIYRQQKKAAESTEEKETRLAKRLWRSQRR